MAQVIIQVVVGKASLTPLTDLGFQGATAFVSPTGTAGLVRWLWWLGLAVDCTSRAPAILERRLQLVSAPKFPSSTPIEQCSTAVKNP